MHAEAVFILLFAVATIVAIAARWLRIPYTVALVLAGLILGTTRSLTAPHLTKELLYAIFLPGLLFEAAFHLDFRRFWQNKIAIHTLAIPGVVASIVVTALLLTPIARRLVPAFTLSQGLIFAALLAATDPIAVVGLFKSLGAPRRLAVLVEGESLLNDGTAVVLFTLILGAFGGAAPSLASAALQFVEVVGVGLLIGLAFGFVASKAIQMIDDPMIEITLTTIAAYGSFVAAEQLHFSGVIATVAAGMLCGNYGARTGMSPSTRIAVESFWEYVAFALNSVVFLLIGLEVHIDTLLGSWKIILAAFVAVSMGRAVVVGLATAGLGFTRERLPWSWAIVLTWGGLRGGLSMVLALALALDFPQRELLVTMTFGVVILSILLQGLSMGPLLRWLGLVGAAGERLRYEAARGAQRAAQAALRVLERLGQEGSAQTEVLLALRTEYEDKVREADVRIRDQHLAQRQLHQEELHGVRRQLLLAEKDAVLTAQHQGQIGREATEHLLEALDARLVRLETDEGEGIAKGGDGDSASPAP